MRTPKKNWELKSRAPEEKKPGQNFPVVGIGASAGGIEAITELLKNLSPQTGMGYVYIQHLDPSHESMLATILAKSTKMTVLEAKNGLHIKPDHVYVIPPNKEMRFSKGMLRLVTRPAKPALSMPINEFFLSLAETVKEGAIGIVLSGNASDGALGLKAIKMAGGLTFAQDDTAKFKSMPQSSIAEGAVDFVLPPGEIAKVLERLVTQSITPKDMMTLHEEFLPGTDSVEDLDKILIILKKNTGVDFSHYKKNTIRRRIIRRMVLHKLGSLDKYRDFLYHNPSEANSLYQDLLITVTSFFRDPDIFTYLKNVLFPRILKNKSTNDPVRIWVPACSTGEEAYSIAMTLMEVMDDSASQKSVQIFATDLNEDAITKARHGIYSKSEITHVNPKRIQKFFTLVDGNYRIIKNIRDLCIFAPHDVFIDPPFSRIDLVSCCNLLIYVDHTLQKKLISSFHYSLVDGGYLVLGKSETIGDERTLFIPLEKKLRIYSRKNNASGRILNEKTTHRKEHQKKEEIMAATDKIKKDLPLPTNLERQVDNILLNQFVPACVVVNQDLEILQFRGSTSLFLEPAPGRASLNIMKMARTGLAFEIKNGVSKARKSGESVRKPGLEMTYKNHKYKVTIEVVPLNRDGEEQLYLIIFSEDEVPVTAAASISSAASEKIRNLEKELMAAREDMRSMLEEQEAVNEELQSANEEIVSSNEELQSINEELETSKEEVESANEELMTVNQEIQIRNDQLGELSEYLEAILDTIREPILVLDGNLRIKRANRSFYKTFKTNEEDTEAHLLFELGNGQWNIPRLRNLMEDVLKTNSHFQGFEVSYDYPVIGKRVMLLNARKVIQKRIQQNLILLAFEDITEQASAHKIIEEQEAWFQNIADNAPVIIWVSDAAGRHVFHNKTWLDFTGRKSKQDKGLGWKETIHPDDLKHFMDVFKKSSENRRKFSIECRLRRKDGEYRWVKCNGRPINDIDGTFKGYFGTCYDIHETTMNAEELETRIKERTSELSTVNANLIYSNNELQQFAFVASHDLQEPLRKIITYSDRLGTRYRDILPDEGRNYLNKITNSSVSMKKLIQDLLEISRVDILKEKFAPINLREIVEEVLKEFEVLIIHHEARIKITGLPVVPAVPSQMKQLFRNLINNSLKFKSNSRKPLITISYRVLGETRGRKYARLKKNRSYVEILVKDNGIGFKPEYREQVFEPFQRLNDKAKFEGSGIGLTLCRKIVTAHDGIIYADPNEGKGTLMHVILPS